MQWTLSNYTYVCYRKLPVHFLPSAIEQALQKLQMFNNNKKDVLLTRLLTITKTVTERLEYRNTFTQRFTNWLSSNINLFFFKISYYNLAWKMKIAMKNVFHLQSCTLNNITEKWNVFVTQAECTLTKFYVSKQ